MGIYYGEPTGFIIHHKSLSTMTDNICKHCNGTGKIQHKFYNHYEHKYSGDDWPSKLAEYIKTADLDTIDRFSFIAPTSSTYSNDTSTSSYSAWTKSDNSSFTEWMKSNLLV
jgi:predicted AlkP superfamily phosphohydrolase/phosphomutase